MQVLDHLLLYESMYFVSLNLKRSTLNFCLKIVSSTLHMLHGLHRELTVELEPFCYWNIGVEIRTIGKSVSLCFSEDVDEIISNE